MKGFTAFGARAPRGDIAEVLRRLQGFARAHAGDAQLLDASAVLGSDHLLSAYEHAARARERGTAVASSLAVEFLRYAAGERRIDRAIARVGAKPGRPVVVVLFGRVPPNLAAKECGLLRDDRVLASRGRSLRGFGITLLEERALPRGTARDLVLERVALADLGK